MEADAAGRAVPELHAGGERCRRQDRLMKTTVDTRGKKEYFEMTTGERGSRLKFILRSELSHSRTE